MITIGSELDFLPSRQRSEVTLEQQTAYCKGLESIIGGVFQQEGFPAPPVQKGQQELLSPSDTSFQMVPWLCCPLPSTQCLELQLKSVLALSV